MSPSDLPLPDHGRREEAGHQTISYLHQIIIVDDRQTPKILPPSIAANTDAAQAIYPDAQYTMWNGNALRAFIETHFDEDVLWAFDTLAPYSYKCDLGRFCLLHAMGGLYVDLGVRLMMPWTIATDVGIAAFRDLPFVTGNWMTMQTGLIWARPRRPEFEHAIRAIVENCRSRYYGAGPLYPTGPVVLGRAMAAILVESDWTRGKDQSIGICRPVTPESGMGNVAYLSQEGGLVALRNKVVPGDLSHLGLQGGNNYNEVWRARRVYGETDQRWTLAESRSVRSSLVRTRSGLAVPLGTSGHVSWGPYARLADGAYRASFDVSDDTVASRVHLEVCAESGTRSIKSLQIDNPLADGSASFGVDFVLDRSESDLECRLSLFGDFQGVIRSLSIATLPVRHWAHNDLGIVLGAGIRRTHGILIQRGMDGLICEGPAITVPKGNYLLEVSLSNVSRWSQSLTVAVDTGRRMLASKAFTKPELTTDMVASVPFTATTDLSEVTFRLVSFRRFKGLIQGFTLTRLVLS